ncbi:thermonuclease family protein [Phyllobacterium zundukense]|nr:thermonuclease family protein [Phyllobacterium zundukense]
MSDKLKVIPSEWTRPPADSEKQRRQYRRYSSWRWHVQRWALPVLGVAMCFLYLAVFPEPMESAHASLANGQQLYVIDGDTIWLNREKIRLANIDTPEIGGAKCESELARGLEAKPALKRLLDGKEIQITRGDPKTRRMIDQYGRTLALVAVNGKDVGETLIERNLARRWTGRRQPWC